MTMNSQATLFATDEIERRAVISECGQYRYMLSRAWKGGHGILAWCMLNPSRADANRDDNTVTKITEFSRRWGYSGLVVVNLFAVRATDPKNMKSHAAPVGPENDGWLRTIAGTAERFVCAWGNHGSHQGRDKAVADLVRSVRPDVHRMPLTGAGQPGHPLMLPYSTPMAEWKD